MPEIKSAFSAATWGSVPNVQNSKRLRFEVARSVWVMSAYHTPQAHSRSHWLWGYLWNPNSRLKDFQKEDYEGIKHGSFERKTFNKRYLSGAGIRRPSSLAQGKMLHRVVYNVWEVSPMRRPSERGTPLPVESLPLTTKKCKLYYAFRTWILRTTIWSQEGKQPTQEISISLPNG